MNRYTTGFEWGGFIEGPCSRDGRYFLGLVNWLLYCSQGDRNSVETVPFLCRQKVLSALKTFLLISGV